MPFRRNRSVKIRKIVIKNFRGLKALDWNAPPADITLE